MENWEKQLKFIKVKSDGYIYDGNGDVIAKLAEGRTSNFYNAIDAELELAKQEERERIESVKNYLYDIEIPPGDAKIDVNFDVKYYAMKMEDKLKAEFVASKLKYWLKLQVLYLEKGLKKQIASIHQNNNEQGGK